ncbi:MAG: ribose 5-phosphate isomerase B [Nitrosopumilaceae archaeon]
MNIILGADHAGYEVKEKIKNFLEKEGYNYEDMGVNSEKPSDYPDYAFKVAEKVAKNKNSVGILICGTGIGMSIAANKVKGIRAAVCYDNYSAKMAKKDDNINILCLRARKMPYKKNQEIIKIWLNTSFSKEKRHKRRISKIKEYEK